MSSSKNVKNLKNPDVNNKKRNIIIGVSVLVVIAIIGIVLGVTLSQSTPTPTEIPVCFLSNELTLTTQQSLISLAVTCGMMCSCF